MSTKTKPHKSKKPRSKRKKSKKGLGATKMAATKGLVAKAAKPLGVILGLVTASAIGYGLDKLPFLAVDPAQEGFSVKKLIKPLVLIGTGATLVLVTHKKSGAGADIANGLGWGIAGGGVFSGVKSFTGKDVFTGLGRDASAEKASLQVQYFKDKADDMANILEKSRYTVEIPEYAASAGAMNGSGGPFTSQMDLLNMDGMV